MDLSKLIDPNFGLIECKNNTGLRFGENNQIRIIGWSGKNPRKKYIVFCEHCAKDSELYGEGYFPTNLSNLKAGKIPCGCSKARTKTREQYRILAERECKDLGLSFVDWYGDFNGIYTKCSIECPVHGIYTSTSLNSLLNQHSSCKKCHDANHAGKIFLKSDKNWIDRFLLTGSFDPYTTFTRSNVLNKRGYKTFWQVDCPVCGWSGLSDQSNLVVGKTPCSCSVISKMTEGYINILSDNGVDIALKFGISSSSSRRAKIQNRSCIYDVRQLGVWVFPDFYKCRKSETEIKNTLECGIIPKVEMPDGYTETTHLYNFDKIVEIFQKYGAVKSEF